METRYGPGEAYNRPSGDGTDAGPQSRAAELQNYVATKIEMMKKAQINIQRVTQLASFIPDYILKEENTKIPYVATFDAAVLMIDISGFTALTEAYSLKGKGGTDQLTKTLSSYMTPLAGCILRCDGDIIKYAGDAFLAVWKVEDLDDYPEDIQRVIDCGLYIQEKYGSFLCPEVNITIKVKVGIGAGTVHACGIGCETYHHYECFGPGVEAASYGEKHCTSGEVCVHESAWNYCTPANFKFTTKPAHSDSKTYYYPTDIVNFINLEKRGRPTDDKDSRRVSSKQGGGVNSDDKPRQAISAALEKKAETYLRLFIIPPVLKKVDDEIPLEYLNESRNVSICFIQIETAAIEPASFSEVMGSIVQKAFGKVYQIASRMQGCLNKVIMFDKGLTYLVVFGLPSFISENQSAHALKFSYHTRRSLKQIRYVKEVSIGVTTGSCYCGVLGNPKRQEYTVIGRKVNKAARLMCNYPGKLTCDQDTMYHAKLPVTNFELLETRELKGMTNVGKIYEFLNAETGEEQSLRYYEYPLIGRDAELNWIQTNLFMKAKKEFTEYLVARVGTMAVKKDQTTSQNLWMTVIEGETGIGKSRLLGAAMDEAEKLGIKTIPVVMNLLVSGQAHYAISTMAMLALQMEDLKTNAEKEDHLRRTVQDSDLLGDLCVLNDVFHTKFPVTPKYASMDVGPAQKLGQHILASVIKAVYPETLLLFVVDEAHLMDTFSWEYLIHLCKGVNVIGLCALRKNSAGSPKLPQQVSSVVYGVKNIRAVKLFGLDPKHCLPLACQILQVHCIPTGLEKLLMAKSQGVPAWIDQVLTEFLRQGILKIEPYNESSFKKSSMAKVDATFIKKHVPDASKQPARRTKWVEADKDSDELGSYEITTDSTQKKDDINPEERMLAVKSGTNIAAVPIPGTLKEIMLDSYDELNSNEQMILKCASTLGLQFSVQLVQRLLPLFELNSKKYDNGFRHLIESRYFRCASGKPKDQTSTTPECFCRQQRLSYDETTHKEEPSKRPKYWNCRFMEFVKENLVEVVYELMTEDQRKELHLKAAKYMDSTTLKCENCGGEDISYVFGFAHKPGELGLGGSLQPAFRLSASIKKKSQEISNEYMDALPDSLNKDRNKRPSFQTQLDGLKKTFTGHGVQIGEIELDILRILKKFDAKDENITHKLWTCACRNKEEFGDDELVIFTPPSEDNAREDKHQQGDTGEEKKLGEDLEASRQRLSSIVDLRFCECSQLQTKVSIEMVKHYRVAQKYGKCLANLLDAAEAVITIGNGSQALIHLEDALGLMKAIENKVLPAPEPDDPDDARIDDEEATGHIEFLSGLAYFEIGIFSKARDYFTKALKRHGISIPTDENKLQIRAAILKAKSKLWRWHKFPACSKKKTVDSLIKEGSNNENYGTCLKILSYLNVLYMRDRKLDMALLVTMWQVMTAEKYGNLVQDVLAAYSNMMDVLVAKSELAEAHVYEKLALEVIRATFGSTDQVDPVGLLSSSNVFYTIASVRLYRGDLAASSDAAYIALRISQTIHDNMLIIRTLPTLFFALLMSLKISEVVQTLQKLWFTSEEEEDPTGVALYYTGCLVILLNTAYPVEPFGVCEHYVLHFDWSLETSVLREHELQFGMECCLALWYCRYSKWETARKWITVAESHRPKNVSFVSVFAELKLLECHLIFVNHYLDTKRYQHFAKSKSSAKSSMRNMNKWVKIVPSLKPRFLHMLAYYHRIRSRVADAEKYLKMAEKLAHQHGNQLEKEWIMHNRSAWSDIGLPTVKYFWLEHTETHTLDWHNSGNIPWANIMYTLPLPAWK